MTFQQVPNAELRSDTARQNLLTNGGFEIWQRGVGVFLTHQAWTADRWQLFISVSSCQVVQEITYQVSGTACAKLVYTHVSGGWAFIEQKLEPGLVRSLRGKTVSVSVKTFTSVAGGHFLQLVSDGTNPISPAATAPSSAVTTLRVTGTVPTDATYIAVRLGSGGTTDNLWFDEAMLVVGSVAADYAPLHPADDLARCLRYYEVVGVPGTGDLAIAGYAGASSNWHFMTNWQVQKVITPTVTKIGTWSVINCTQPACAVPTVYGMQSYYTITAANTYSIGHNTGGGAGWTVEANP
jgi:hypothetical protein